MIQEITILGSTGSIGSQTLELCQFQGIKVHGLACGKNIDLLYQQILDFEPEVVAVADVEAGQRLVELLKEDPRVHVPKVYLGSEGIKALAEESVELVLCAIVGMAGLEPCLAAAKVGNPIGLANKESLVCAGPLLLDLVAQHDQFILPVDSEHWAIFDCIGDQRDQLKSVFLTASGGPFRGATKAELKDVTVEDALNHPVWAMGPKITIDSATMMNKGLEMIEAAYLFSLKEEQITPVVHPQSLIHSAVLWMDGSCTAQLGFPDMRQPIQGVLSYPEKVPGLAEPFNFLDSRSQTMTFEPVDEDVFSCVRLARYALRGGGSQPLVLNAANEVAVGAFLQRKIPFLAIEACVEWTLEQYVGLKDSPRMSYEALIDLDDWARETAKEYLDSHVS